MRSFFFFTEALVKVNAIRDYRACRERYTRDIEERSQSVRAFARSIASLCRPDPVDPVSALQ